MSNSPLRNKRLARRVRPAGAHVRSAGKTERESVPPSGVCVHLSRAMEERRDVFYRQLVKVRRRAGETAIHDLRVALRRLIAAINLAEEVVPRTRIPKVRRSLRRALKQFNAIRDVHIALLAIKRIQRPSPPVRSYSLSLRRKERTLLRECAAFLRSMNVQDIDRELAAVQQSLLVMSTDRVLDAAAAAIMKGTLARDFSHAVRLQKAVTASDPSSVHRLRVAFKKVRYASEVLAPLLPWITRSRRKWMQAYQTSMGDVQDSEVKIASVQQFASTPSIRNRVSVLPLLETLAREKRERMEAFMQRAGELDAFWDEA